MPDTREHRGPHPDDGALFAPAVLPRLRTAVADFSLLLTRGYAGKSALKLVGDRFSLTQRQRLAVMRGSCSDQQLASRLARCVPVEALAGQPLAIDGYNLLITIEAALSGGLLFRGRDGCLRDLASIHGTYRKVEETVPAVRLIGEFLTEIGVSRVAGASARGVEPDAQRPFGPGPPSNQGQGSPNAVFSRLGTQEALATRGQDARDTHAPVLWLFDSPVSNSGRLKTLVGALARENGWAWEIRLTISPDAELRSGLTVPGARPPADRPVPAIVVSTDSVVLDGCPRWTNLAAALIATRLPGAAVLDLGAPPA